MSNPDATPPLTDLGSAAVHDFVTDPNLVAEMIAYRQQKGFTVMAVYVQGAVTANYVTALPQGGFPTATSLGIGPQVQAWVIVSKV